MTSGILGHWHFEELCALASIGQISPLEYEELSKHMRQCIPCRESYAEFVHLTHDQLPLLDHEHLLNDKAISFVGAAPGHADYKARFIAVAQRRGFNISGREEQRRRSWPRWPVFSLPQPSYQYAFVVIICVLMGTIALLSHRWKDSNARGEVLAEDVSNLRERNIALQNQVDRLAQGKQNSETEVVKTSIDSPGLANHLRQLQAQVQKDVGTIESLNRQLSVATDHGVQAEQELRVAQQTLLAVNREIATLRTSRTDDRATTVAKQLEIADMSRRAKEQDEIIDKQQKLLAVDADVRNLMAARNLHITDVFDVDGKGRRKAAFGRVFYTEGKSLIFYAFDLDAPKGMNSKHSFQAWGQLADSSTSAVNLGIFYVDDPAQKRWMLKFDNPGVLEKISAVFVTAEPHGGVNRPSGQKLMYAYLGHEPNHP